MGAKVYSIKTKKPIITDSLKDEIKEAIQEGKVDSKTEEHQSERKRRSGSGSGSQNGVTKNITAYDRGIAADKIDKIVFQGKGSPKINPPPDTIGAEPHLVKIINDKITELAETRARDFVKRGEYPDRKTAIGMVYNHPQKGINPTFKRNFGLPYYERRRPITIIKEWNVNRFDEVLIYFEEKLRKTATGKIKGAVKRHKSKSFYELMNEEKRLLAKIYLKPDSPEVYEALQRYYGISSHKNFSSPDQHNNWIAHIESIVDKVEKGLIKPEDIKL